MSDVPGIKVELMDHFSIVRESLDRIGVGNKSKKILNPSCYLLHKKGEYYIIHFKNLLALDGKPTTFNEADNIRQSSIARLLEKWGLVKIIDERQLQEETTSVFVLPFKEKNEWQIIHKYKIGKLTK